MCQDTNENEQDEGHNNGAMETAHQSHIDSIELNMESDSDDESLILSFQGHQSKFNMHGQDAEDILIDTGSTHSVFKSKNMLTNMKMAPHRLRAFTNGGHQDSTMLGDLPGFFTVWYNPQSLVNILSMSDVRKRFRITADTRKDAALYVHMDNGKLARF